MQSFLPSEFKEISLISPKDSPFLISNLLVTPNYLKVLLEMSNILIILLEVTTAMYLFLASIAITSPSYSDIGKFCLTSPVNEQTSIPFSLF